MWWTAGVEVNYEEDMYLQMCGVSVCIYVTQIPLCTRVVPYVSFEMDCMAESEASTIDLTGLLNLQLF